MKNWKIVATICFAALMISLTECRSKAIIDEDMNTQKKLVVVVEKPVVKYVKEQPETKLNIDEEELLAKVVHAEAGNQDMTGKRLVVDCVLNRIDSDEYPNHVFGVVLQEGQFVRSETYTDDDMEAVQKELKERLDYDIIFFRTNHYHDFGTPTYQHGDHFFSKE